MSAFLAGVLALLLSAGAAATQIQLQFQGQFDRLNTFDGTSWTYNIPIPAVAYAPTVRFDDIVSATKETSAPGYFIRQTFFSPPFETPVTPFTASLLAMNPGTFPFSGGNAYIDQGCFGDPLNCSGRTYLAVGNTLIGSDLDPDPNIVREYVYNRWIDTGIDGPASGIFKFSDVTFFTTAMLREFLEDAMLNNYVVAYYEFLGVRTYNVQTGSQQYEWAMQYAGSGTLVGIPEPGTLALLGMGLAGLAATRRRKQ
jgi:hypothetical protein